MFDDESGGEYSLDTLEQLVRSGEEAIARIRGLQARALRLLDAAGVATADGSRNLVDWTAARLDVEHHTAAALVAVARGIPAPLGQELGAGGVSFDRAVAETRLRKTGATEAIVGLSRGLDLAGVRRLAGRHRRILPRDERASFQAQHVSIQPTLDGTGYNLWATLEGFEGRIVEKAIFQRADELVAADEPSLPAGLKLALALTTICQDSLEGQVSDREGSEPVITVMADAGLVATTGGEAGAEIVGGPRIGPLALNELVCLGKIELNVAHPDGTILGVGKTTSSLPPRLRRAVLARDGGCVVDGCSSGYRPEVHHVIERASHGSDDPTNLATLCWVHHHVFVHRRGFVLDPGSPPGRRRLIPPAGSDPPARSTPGPREPRSRAPDAPLGDRA
jgi:hypothetical protein